MEHPRYAIWRTGMTIQVGDIVQDNYRWWKVTRARNTDWDSCAILDDHFKAGMFDLTNEVLKSDN